MLLYGYCTGVASSRRIAQRLHEDIGFRVLAANNTPDFRTVFRKDHLQALGGLFLQVLARVSRRDWSMWPSRCGHLGVEGEGSAVRLLTTVTAGTSWGFQPAEGQGGAGRLTDGIIPGCLMTRRSGTSPTRTPAHARPGRAGLPAVLQLPGGGGQLPPGHCGGSGHRPTLGQAAGGSHGGGDHRQRGRGAERSIRRRRVLLGQGGGWAIRPGSGPVRRRQGPLTHLVRSRQIKQPPAVPADCVPRQPYLPV